MTLLLLVITLGCSNQRDENFVQAYVAPASVNLRSQLNQKNATVAVLKYGDRVTVVDVRRRYVRVRTSGGVEGWIDSLDLLSAADMQRVQRARAEALALPSEGTATAYETLNVHLDPSRKSPAFAQIAEGGAVSVLAYKTASKVEATPRPSLSFERPKLPARKAAKSKQAKNNSGRPPMPPPPRPPANWEEMWGAERVESVQDLPETGTKVPKQSAADKPAGRQKPPVIESWTLVRTRSNQVGWVLSRNLMMSIPDEVAQYAEGKHITSYFELGTVDDEAKGQKHSWLWTTVSGVQPFEFDSWRVFLWNRRRHRYETSYRQRDVEGYFPVHVEPPDPARPGRSFELITKDDDDKFRRRTYFFDGARVHLTGTEDYGRDRSRAR